ncbi:hypothetical protein LPJ57_008502, partial [Coemansia sp. RSA 486]
YHLESGKHADVWSINSLWAYWAFGDSVPAGGAGRALESISQLHQRFPGGLPNTLYNTTLSWDYPHIKPPLQHMVIKSADNSEKNLGNGYNSYSEYKGNAAKIAQSTIDTAFCNWYTTGGNIPGVLNSYDYSTSNSSGASLGTFDIDASGNEVTTTDSSSAGGFTWTTGITIWLLDQYKAQNMMPSCPNIKLNLVNKTYTASTTKVPYESSSPLINTTSQLGQSNSSYVNEPASSLLTNWSFDTNPSFNSCLPPTSNDLATLVQQTTLDNLPTLVNKPPDLDIEEYFNNENSMLYDKKTKKLKGKAPNAFMIYRLSQIKDLKGKRHTPEFINN